MAGFLRSQIIDMAHRRTENRAKGVLDDNAEFAMALQEVDIDDRWWWRRRIKTFTIAAGQATYPLQGDGSLDIEDLQQIPRDGFKIQPSPKDIATLDPVFDLDQQQMIISFPTTPAGTPNAYFVAGNTLYLDPIPDGVYPASLAYWSVPVYQPGGAAGEEEAIPNIPIYLHPLLLKKLELHFLAYSLGEDATKYKVAVLEYNDLKTTANLYNNFAEGQVRSFANGDQQDSIRSS